MYTILYNVFKTIYLFIYFVTLYILFIYYIYIYI